MSTTPMDPIWREIRMQQLDAMIASHNHPPPPDDARPPFTPDPDDTETQEEMNGPPPLWPFEGGF